MSRRRRTNRFGYAFLSFLAAGLLAWGCLSTREIDRRDWGAIPPEQQIRVTTLDGNNWKLKEPRITTDSLHGQPDDTVRGPLVSFPLDSVEYIEIRRVDVGPVIVVLAGVAAGLVIADALGEDDTRPPDRPAPAWSCPHIYSFDGTDYRLDSETYSGAVARALQRVDLDHLEHLNPTDDRYRLLLTNELPETQYTDALVLHAVDHPTETSVFPDAQGGLHTVENLLPPETAVPTTPQDGPDPLAMVSSPDTEYWGGAPLETVELTRDEDLRDGLVLTFQMPAGPDPVLVVRAKNTPLGPFALSEFLGLQGDSLISWYRQLDKDEDLQQSVEDWIEREGQLQIAIDIGGEWVPQGYLRDVGPNMPKTQVATLDLSGVPGDVVRLKLESARGLWELDWVALGNEAPVSGRVWEITASRARDRKGRDVGPELASADGLYYTALPGDTVELEFRAPPLPPPHQTRSILARTTGFYHMWTSHSGPSRPEVASRILSEPLFGNRFLLLKWRASGRS